MSIHYGSPRAWATSADPVYEALSGAIVAASPVSLLGRSVLDLGAGTGATSRALEATFRYFDTDFQTRLGVEPEVMRSLLAAWPVDDSQDESDACLAVKCRCLVAYRTSVEYSTANPSVAKTWMKNRATVPCGVLAGRLFGGWTGVDGTTRNINQDGAR